MAGDTFVNVKWYTTYTSNVSGTWYTRHPTRSWEYEMFGAGSSFERLWPAGNYEVHVRQEGATPGYLSRGRMRIIVCTGCPDPDESEGPQSIASASRIGGLPLGTFGVGPFVVTDEELVSLYDLTGMSIPDDSPFSRTDWITSAGERAGEYPIPGGRLIWRSHRTSETTATITLRADGDALRMTTGLAWDPDLGDPSDDRSAYDETRRMLIAHDETEAIGLLLEIDGHAVPIRVQQYGARRLAPIGMNGIVNAISSPTTLLPEPDDVQFLVMADGVPAGREQRFKIVRAGSLEELLASVPEN